MLRECFATVGHISITLHPRSGIVMKEGWKDRKSQRPGKTGAKQQPLRARQGYCTRERMGLLGMAGVLHGELIMALLDMAGVLHWGDHGSAGHGRMLYWGTNGSVRHGKTAAFGNSWL